MATTGKEEKVETMKKPVTKQQTKPNEPQIYVGPNLAGGRLSRFTVFREGVPAYLSDLIEKQPEIKRLIVPASQITQTLVNVDKAGTIENSAFRKLAKERG